MSISDVDVELLAQPHRHGDSRADSRSQTMLLRGRTTEAPGGAAIGEARADERRAAASSAVSSPVPIAVMSADPALADALTTALDERFEVFACSTLDDALELAAAGRCGVFITDELSSASALRTMAERLRAFDPALIVVGVGYAADQHALMSLLAAGVIDRLMLKPLTPALAHIVLNSVAQQYRPSRRDAPPPQPRTKLVVAPGASPVAPEAAHAEKAAAVANVAQAGAATSIAASAPPPLVDGAASSRLPVWIALIAVLAAAAFAVWWTLSQRQPRIDPEEVIERNLAAGQLALSEGRLAAPLGRSAVDYYNTVLAIDPDNAAARKALAAIADKFMSDAERLLASGQTDAALAALEEVQRVSPEQARIARLQAQLLKAQQAVASPAPAQAADAEQSPSPAAGLTRAAPREERTSAPATIQISSPTYASAPASAPSDTPAQMLLAAETALAEQQLDAAAAAIDSARTAGLDSAALATLENRLASAHEQRLKDNLLQLTLTRVAENRLLGPEDSAKHHLLRLASLDADYPGVQQGVQALGGKLTEDAKLATREQRFEYAAALLDEARSIGFDGVELQTAAEQLALARAPQSTPRALTAERSAPAPTPTLLKRVDPKYPPAAMRERLEGWVELNIPISTSGSVIAPSVINSSSPVFERAALEAARKWRYEPLASGRPNETRAVKARFVFQLPTEKTSSRHDVNRVAR